MGAGQAVVQFARGEEGGGEVAVKFFMSRAAYETQHDAHAGTALAAVLPQPMVMCANSDGTMRDARGRPLPPFFVMPRGEPIGEWAQRRQPDAWTVMPVCPSATVRIRVPAAPPLVQTVSVTGVPGPRTTLHACVVSVTGWTLPRGLWVPMRLHRFPTPAVPATQRSW